MEVLMIGDVVGTVGCEHLRRVLPIAKRQFGIDVCIVNGENAADGNGLTPTAARHILDSGADVITGGNHTFRRHEYYDLLEENEYLLRPANLPSGTPGRGMTLVDRGRYQVAVINLQGTVYMEALTSPFETLDSLLGGKPDPEKIRRIKELMLSYDGILGVHDLVLHDYGPGRCIASAHAEVSVDGDLLEIHEMIDDAERLIVKELNMPICIHMDPIVTDDEQVNGLRRSVEAFLRENDPCLSLHDFRVVPGQGHTNVLFDCVLPAGYKNKEQLHQALTAYLHSLDPRYRLVVVYDTDYT